MKIFLLKSILFFLILPFPIFSQEIQKPEEPVFTIEEKISKLKELSQFLEKPQIASSFSSRDIEIIKKALAYYEEGYEDLGDNFIQYFLVKHEELLNTTKGTLSTPHKIILTLYLFQEYPDQLRSSIKKMVNAYIQSIDTSYHISKKHWSLIERNSLHQNERIDLGAQELCAVLERLKASLDKLPFDAIEEFVLSQKSFGERIKSIMTAIIHRHSTILERSQELQQSIVQLINTGKLTENDILLHRLTETEKKESKINIIFNRQTMTGAGLAASLLGECLTWTISGKTNPGAWTKLAATLTAVGNTLVISNAALNIADRTVIGGPMALLTWDSYMDYLLISLLPWKPLKNIPEFFKLETWKSVQWLKKRKSVEFLKTSLPLQNMAKFENYIWEKMVETQYQAGYFLGIAATGMGTWQIIKANELAEYYRKKGIYISADEIRKKGIYHILLGTLGGLTAYNRYKSYVKAYPTAYEEAIVEAQLLHGEKATWVRWSGYLNDIFNPYSIGKTILIRFKKALEGFRHSGRALFSDISSFSSLMQNLGTFTVGTANFFRHSSVLTLKLLWAQTYPFLLYTYPDTLFMKKIQLPNLKDNEIAAAFNGFDPTDLLYYASHSDSHHREEIKKYQRGKNFFDYDFTSPEDLIRKIEHISKNLGKIKYLKISTHGLPGHMLTRNPEERFMDTIFLKKHMKDIKKITKEAFAPNAQIALFSCLVGGNLDQPSEFFGLKLEENEGDRFIEMLGETFLVNGGKIDSSKNIMLGFNGTYGSIIDYILSSSNYDEALKANFVHDLAKIQIQIDELNVQIKDFEEGKLNELKTKYQENYDSAPIAEILSALTLRFIGMQFQMLELIQQYGINLKGNFFESRHRHDVFEPHE